MKKLSQFLLSFILVALFANVGWGQIAAWDFTGVGFTTLTTYAATTFNANLVSTSGANNITRGAGASWSSGSNSFRTQGFQNNGISTANTDYFQITLTAATGYKFSLSTIDAKFGGTGTFYASPGVTSQFAYSLDGLNFTLIGFPVQSTSLTMTQIDLSGISALQNVAAGTTVTLRYYASGQTTTGGWGFQSAASAGTNGLAIGGTVTSTTSGTSTVTAGAGSEPASLSSLVNAQGDAVLNFDFNILDDGSTPATDFLATQISQIVINQGTGNDITNWTQAIEGALLTDGTNTQITNVTINTTNITFASIPNASGELGYIADNASKTYTLKIWLKSSLGGTLPTTIDGLNLVFGVTNSSFTFNGGSMLDASQDVNSGSTNNTVSVVGTKLLFTANKPPSAVALNTNFAVEVSTTDANGNRDLGDNTSSVTLAKATGTGTLSSTTGLIQTLSSGLFSWTDVRYNTSETFTIQATSPSLTTATSSNISVITPPNVGEIYISHLSPVYNNASDEFVVLFNNTSHSINLIGYELKYFSQGGSPGSAGYQFTTSTEMPARTHILLSPNATITVGSVTSKARDYTFTSGMAVNGQIELREIANTSNIIFATCWGSGITYVAGMTNAASFTTTTGMINLTPTGNTYTYGGGLLHPLYTFDNTGYAYTDAASIINIPNSVDAPLPVSLSSFNSEVFNRNVKLNWVTESELNNSGFEVEKKSIYSDYEKIGFVNGNGTKNTPTSYSFEDKNLNTGKYKYRLKQIDHNGNYEYFELNGEVEIGVPKKYDISQNYPNPFNPVTKINFDLPENGLVNIRLYDMLGREVAVLVNEVRNAGYHTVQFDASKLSSGIYFYKMSAGKFNGIKKMAVIK